MFPNIQANRLIWYIRMKNVLYNTTHVHYNVIVLIKNKMLYIMYNVFK